MKENPIYIEHIIDSINAIEDFSKDLDRNTLFNDRLRKSAIIREIEVIGEAVKNISLQLKNKYLEIPWKQISGTRDNMVHHYFGIDFDIVWNIIKFDLPNLKEKMLKIKKELFLIFFII